MTCPVRAFLPDHAASSGQMSVTCHEPDLRKKYLSSNSSSSSNNGLMYPPWLIYLPEDDTRCEGITPDPYWYNDRIHTFGNTGIKGGFHAFVAPLATKIIDRAAYKNEDVRTTVSKFLHQKLVSSRINKDSRFHVLDLCCGVGISTRALAKSFAVDADLVLGIDTSPEMIVMARGLTRQEYHWEKRSFQNGRSAEVGTDSNENEEKTKRITTVAQFSRGNAERLQLPSQSFDLVTLMYAFHEAPYLGRSMILREARRLLKHNGTLAIVDICPEYTPSDTMLEGEPYVLEYQQNIMRQMAQVTGFSEKEYHTLVPGHVGLWLTKRQVRANKRRPFAL